MAVAVGLIIMCLGPMISGASAGTGKRSPVAAGRWSSLVMNTPARLPATAPSQICLAGCKTMTDYIEIDSVPYTSPTMSIGDGGSGLSTAAGELCKYEQEWAVYTKQVFAYKATESVQLEFRTCDSNGQTTDFQHIFMLLECPSKLAFADGKDADTCSCPAPLSCGAYGKRNALTTKPGYWYYAVVVATWASWPYTRQYLLTVSVEEPVPDSPPPAPYFGDYVTNPVSINSLPFTSGQQTIAQGPYGIPQAISSRTPYKYTENTPLRSRIFMFKETAAAAGAAGRTLTAKTCVAGELPNFNHLIWVVDCPHKLASKSALDSGDCSVSTGSSCVGAAPDWYSMKRTFVTAPDHWYYIFVLAVNTAEGDSTNSLYTLSLEETPPPPAPPSRTSSPPPPPPRPPPPAGTSMVAPIRISELPYTSPTLNVLSGSAGISSVVGELCHYTQDWGVYTKQVIAYQETVGPRAVQFRTCDANAETTLFQHALWVLDCPTALGFADGMDASKCACVDPVSCGGTGQATTVATKLNRWYYVVVIATTWSSQPYIRKYLLTAQLTTSPPPAPPYLGDYVSSPVVISALPYTSPQWTIAQGTYGVPKAIGDRTPYKYTERTPIRKRIFAFYETAAAGRTLTAKTCVAGALPNFNHLVWVVDCPHKLASKEALDSANCSVVTGSSCVGAAPDWYSMKCTFPTKQGRWYYMFIIATGTTESNNVNSLYSLSLAEEATRRPPPPRRKPPPPPPRRKPPPPPPRRKPPPPLLRRPPPPRRRPPPPRLAG